MYSALVKIEGLPPMSNKTLNSSWQKNLSMARAWKLKTVVSFARMRPPEPLTKAKLILYRHSSIRPDHDGLVSGFKHIIDGLVQAEVLADDKFEVIGQPEYHWQFAKPKNGHVIIMVEAI